MYSHPSPSTNPNFVLADWQVGDEQINPIWGNFGAERMIHTIYPDFPVFQKKTATILHFDCNHFCYVSHSKMQCYL